MVDRLIVLGLTDTLSAPVTVGCKGRHLGAAGSIGCDGSEVVPATQLLLDDAVIEAAEIHPNHDPICKVCRGAYFKSANP
jgi:hypothetical protein